MKACRLPRPSWPSTLPPPPLSWVTSSTPSVLERPIPSWHPAPQAAGLAHRVTGLGGHATVAGDMLLHWAEGLAPLPTGQGQEWWPPWHPKEGQTKGNKPKKRWRAIRAGGGGQRLPRAEQWGSPCECIRPGDWEWRGKAKGSDEGMEGQSGGRRKSSHAAWDKSFVALSDSQSINWCLLEPGTQGSVEERRAREEIRRTGMASCPGLHFAVIICTNSS